jgi:hypothetical protein
MTLIDALLGIAVVSTGLFTGLLMTILAFFQKALKDLTGPQFALVIQRFLGIVRTPLELRHGVHLGLCADRGARSAARRPGQR